MSTGLSISNSQRSYMWIDVMQKGITDSPSIVRSFQPSPIHWVSKQYRGEQCHGFYRIRQETHLRSQISEGRYCR